MACLPKDSFLVRSLKTSKLVTLSFPTNAGDRTSCEEPTECLCVKGGWGGGGGGKVRTNVLCQYSDQFVYLIPF